MPTIAGQVALVTGAARGIGAATARELARRGARVSLVGLEPDELERVAADCGPDAAWFEADVRDVDALARAVEGTADRFGGIDVCMANAGVASGGTFRHARLDAVESVLEINLIGVVRTVKLCLPHLIARRGYLLPVASMSAIAPSPGLAAYAATKAGIEAFANALRLELKPVGVDVGVAYYSWIDTDLVRGGDDRRDFAHLRGTLRGPLAKTYPVGKAAAATVRGIERRMRWVAYPGWIKPLILVRGALPLLAGAQLDDAMATLDRLSAEEAERLGAVASQPAGAGGRAAVRSPSAR